MPETLIPGAGFPALNLKLISGETVTPGTTPGQWELIVVYRGIHCPRCKTYIAKLEKLKSDFQKMGVSILLACADSVDQVTDDIKAGGWTLPVAYGLTVSDMKTLGLYMSQHADGSHYAEPGLFVINADQILQVVGIGNTASCRPDLDVLLDGINGMQTRNLPIAGTSIGD